MKQTGDNSIGGPSIRVEDDPLNRLLLSTILVTIVCVAGPAGADAFAKENEKQKGKPHKDVLVIYGNDFSFQVKEPAGWHGDAKPEAKYQANLVIHGKGGWRVEKPFVAVRVNSKTDENIEKDLRADMEIYRKSFPGVKFDTLDVRHPYYKSASKLFYVNHDFYEYVCYLNPGKKSPFLLSVSLSKQKEPASNKELEALTKIVESLEIFNLTQHDNKASTDMGL